MFSPNQRTMVLLITSAMLTFQFGCDAALESSAMKQLDSANVSNAAAVSLEAVPQPAVVEGHMPEVSPDEQAALNDYQDQVSEALITLFEAPVTTEVVASYRPEEGKVSLKGEIDLGVAPLSFSLRFERKDERAFALLQDWGAMRNVTLHWKQQFAYLDGADPEEIQIQAAEVPGVLFDGYVRPICGRDKVMAAVTIEVDGAMLNGAVTLSVPDNPWLSFNPMALSAAPAITAAKWDDAADDACEDSYFLWFDYGCSGKCKYQQRSVDQTQDVCLRVQVGGGIQVAPYSKPDGGGEIDVEYENRVHRQTLRCWEEYQGTCKLIGSFIEYCSCHAPKAPKIECMPVGPCSQTTSSCSSPSSCSGQ